MTTRQQVAEILERVLVPDTRLSIMQLNLLRSVEIGDHRIKITLSDAATSADVRDQLRSEIQARLRGLDGVSEIVVDFRTSNPGRLNKIDKVVAVVSGKGGVGKSLVTGLLAIAMSRQGKQVGILDADVTGPSIPRMFNIKERPGGSEAGLLPPLSRTGIKIMSMNLLVPQEDDAVIWSGPVIARSVRRFWKDVLWGKLDLLMLDTPPGTSDVPLMVMQSLPLSGIVIVLTPQDLTAMVVRKTVKMAQKMGVPVLGVVENMSYFLLPGTGNRIDIFGQSKVSEMARITGAPVLGQIPVDPDLARLCDEGDIESYDSEVFHSFQEIVTGVLSPAKKARQRRNQSREVTVPQKEELIARVVDIEWKMFQRVPNIGGKSACQEDHQTFEINRSSQAVSWSAAALESYLGDLTEAENQGRNLLTEKYARMMKSTSPMEYALIGHHIPPLDPEVVPLIDQILQIVLEWEEMLVKKYPHVLKRGRPLHSSEDAPFVTSLETYLRGELATYSPRTLRLYYENVLQQKSENINGSELTLAHMMKRHGLNSLSEANERLKLRH